MSAFSFPFEELPDFWVGDYRSGLHNGTAEIEPTSDGDFVIASIHLDCTNGESGPAAASKSVELSRAYQGAMFDALCDSIERFHGDTIRERLAEMQAEAA